MVETTSRNRVPTVHIRGASAIRRPLIVLAVCAVGVIGYVGRDFLVPTAGAVVLALMLTPVANTLEKVRLPPSVAAGCSVILLALLVVGLLAIAFPSISSWAEQAPMLTATLEKRLEGLRKSLAVMQEVSNRVEQAASATASPAATAPEKVVVRERSLLGEVASTTPGVVLQLAYAGVLAFMLLAHRNIHRRQMLRIPQHFDTRMSLARVMRDINERVGHYLFLLVVIYSGVAVTAATVLALLGMPNAIVWGAALGFASFVPFVGPPVVIGLVAVVGVLTFDDWQHMVAVPVALVLIHFIESQFVTPALVSRRFALNTTAVFVTIALLGWMWGAIGAIVAVPMLILISTVASHLPSLHWLEVLLSDDHATVPGGGPNARPPAARTRPAATPRQPRRRLAAAK